MRVKEHLTNLFSTIENKKSDLLIFTYIDSNTLDDILINLYGEQTLSKTGNLEIDRIATIVINMFGNKWDNTIETYLESLIDITKGGYSLVEGSTSNNINTVSRTVLNKVSAYNDVDMTDNIEDVEELTGGNEEEKTLDKQVVKNVGIDNIIKIIDFLDNFYMYEIVMEDVRSILTLKIYN